MVIIETYGWLFISLALLFGLYMTWGIGANDVANAMGTSVGSGAITVKQAIIIAAIFEFAGAYIAGGNVTKTIRKGIINADVPILQENPQFLIYGMLAALLAAGIWLMVASAKGWPVSTTHTIVGAIVGFAIAGIGMDSVEWGKVGQIVASWVVSPVVGGVIAFLLMVSVQRLIFNSEQPLRNARTYAPIYVFLVGFIVSLVTMFKGLKNLKLELETHETLLWAGFIGLLMAFIGRIMISKVDIRETDDKDLHFRGVEKVFTPLMLFTACAMAFAHGSNDVANGIGPLAAVLSLVENAGDVNQSSPLPWWVLALGGAGIVIGLATLGYRVMQTIGKKITELTPTRGYCATLAAASTVVLASKTGLPVSTTHIAVGSVLGVGLARGMSSVDMRVIGSIVISWIVTLPAGGILAAIFFFILKAIFG